MKCARGFSLIELMLAMLLGLVLFAGMVAVFTASSSADASQAQLNRLQEEARFALAQMRQDISLAGAPYCSDSGGAASAVAMGYQLDQPQPPQVLVRDGNSLLRALADITTPWGSPYPPAPVAVYSLPGFLSMRGYDCSRTACAPVEPAEKGAGFGIPRMGSRVGDRVIGADVVTVRYVDPAGGYALASDGSDVSEGADHTLSIRLPRSYQPDARHFPLAMLADCNLAQIFTVSGQGSRQLFSTGANFRQPVAPGRSAAVRLFDVGRDLRTVSYYLRVVDTGDGHITGALIRRVNGGIAAGRDGSAEELARGVERLDLRYGVRRADGTLQYLDAAQVDASQVAACALPPLPLPGDGRGCLWASVVAIEVHLLLSGQKPLHALSEGERDYAYVPDGVYEPAAADVSGRAVTPAQQGFPQALLRREFSTVVALRNRLP